MIDNQLSNEHNAVALALSIIVNRDELPIGVMVPVTDWLKIKLHLHPDSPLYTLLEKLAADYTDIGGSKPNADQAIRPPDGTYIRYKDETCTDEQMFIQEYADRRVRVNVHPHTDAFEFIETID